MIERILVLCDTRKEKEKFERELMFKSNDNIKALYESAKPKLEARREQLDRVLRREKRRQQRVYAMRQHEELCNAWSRRWTHPRVAYPIQPKFEFGLADLQHMAMFLLRYIRDYDVGAKILARVERISPKHRKVALPVKIGPA